jgi:acyl transferase domain-containing protein
MPVDTACSSSLVAIHLACESLRNGDSQVAIAGGVNLYLHPSKYHSLCQRHALSIDGKCHSYGAGGDGFVPGEGVGTLVLKPLRKALEDRDRIHAVIRGSAFDHSGRSNGYSAPNPNAQASLISRTLEKANIHPETIGYVEGHGTGTQLGDSIEIAALSQAFQKQTARKQFCPIGSVKANIGHAESAAGIAGLAKVVLQMEHGQLAPSIYSDQPNPNIEFSDSPFYLQHGLRDWTASSVHPRRALVNSFGAGGVNACVVLEEHPNANASDGQDAGPWLFTLSARSEDRLRDYADRLLGHLRGEQAVELAGLCYTLQVGREAMEERLAIVVSDVTELIERLSEWKKYGVADGLHRGSLGPRRGSRRSAKLARSAMGEQGLTELAARWVAGEEVDWESLYATAPRRVSAPTYPFARERYWVSDALVPEKPAVSSAQLHPLIAYNSSTLKEVSFSSALSDTAFYAVDHKVQEERIFPGAGFLEMACISANIASEQKVRKITDVVWMQPLSFRSGAQSVRTVLKGSGDNVEFVISSLDDDVETVVHSEGRVAFANGTVPDGDERIPIQALKAQCARPEEGAACYEKFNEFGLHYGLSFQPIQELHINGSFALAKLKIADHLKADFGQFILHPSLIDGALQAAAGLVGSLASPTPFLPFALDEIEIIRPVPQTCYAYVERAGGQTQNHSGVSKFDIKLLSESGEVLIKFRNLYVRPLARPLTSGLALVAAAPVATGRLLRLSGELGE